MLTTKVNPTLIGSLVLILAATAVVSPAASLPSVYSDPDGVAIDGYDTVERRHMVIFVSRTFGAF